jgi:hypothetical protein
MLDYPGQAGFPRRRASTTQGGGYDRSVDQPKSFLSKQLDDRSTQAGQRLGVLAGDLRLVGEQLREYGAPRSRAPTSMRARNSPIDSAAISKQPTATA